MKKQLFVFILLVLMLNMLAACASGNGDSLIQTSTPDPNAKVGTPVPSGEIKVPGVTIKINAPGPNPLVNKPDADGHVAGVLLGLWHGIISPVTLIISFFNNNVQIYEVHNDGNQYNLGFMLGLVVLLLVLMLSSRR